MFSKDWLENCSCSLSNYETPAKEVPKTVDDEIEELDEKPKKKLDIKKLLASMEKRRKE